MRIPLLVDLQINAFDGASITEKESGITNGMIDITLSLSNRSDYVRSDGGG